MSSTTTPQMGDKVVKEYKVFLRPDSDVKLLRLPESLPSRKITRIRVKPQSQVMEIDARPRKSCSSTVYKGRRMVNHSSLAVGVIRDGNIFLTQVSDAFEFKPNLNRDSKKKSTGKETGDTDAVESQPSTSKPPPVQPVTMRFASSHEEEMRKQRESSYTHYLEKIASEDWVDLDFHPGGEESEKGKEVKEALGRV